MLRLSLDVLRDNGGVPGRHGKAKNSILKGTVQRDDRLLQEHRPQLRGQRDLPGVADGVVPKLHGQHSLLLLR